MEWTVSDFMTNTCRVRPQPNTIRFDALCHATRIANIPVEEGCDYTRITTSSGSASEFYIEPIWSCINDFDIMWHRNDQLAIPEGYPVQRRLPAEFHREVQVVELSTHSEFPSCYVFVRRACTLIKCTDSPYYERVSAGEYEGSYVGSGMSSELSHHGPAVLSENMSPARNCLDYPERGTLYRSVDVVTCIRCLVWPPQSDEWTTRQRDYNWPDAETISRVVLNGCDVVQVAHPKCQADKWLSVSQWRLSFSRAETVLINTWSPIQQLVYHMLRVLVSGIQNESVVKRYHIKTLMLWICESHPQVFSLPCVDVCVQLLRTFGGWLTSGTCLLYFIPTCNLFDCLGDVDRGEFECFVSRLIDVSTGFLNGWFIDHYVRHCLPQHPHFLSRLCATSSTPQELHGMMTIVCDWRQHYSRTIARTDFEQVYIELQNVVGLESVKMNTISNRSFINGLRLIDARFMGAFRALCSLRTVSLLNEGASVESALDALVESIFEFDITTTHQINMLSQCRVHSTVSYYLNRARSCDLSEHQALILNEVLKFYVSNALSCGLDCYLDEHVGCILACLYYGGGQFKTTLVHCSRLIRLAESERCSMRVSCIERHMLPQVNDSIECVIGVVLLYQFIRNSLSSESLKQEQTPCVTVFSVDILTHFLVTSCIRHHHSHVTCAEQEKCLTKCKKRASEKKYVFISDILLLYYLQDDFHKQTKQQVYSIAHECEYELLLSTMKSRPNEFNASRLSALLIQSSVEYLTAFRRVMSRDYSSVNGIITYDFEAIYANACGLYEECFYLSSEMFKCFVPASTGEGNIISRALTAEDSDLSLMVSDICQIDTSVFLVDHSALLVLMDCDFVSLISLVRLCDVFDLNSACGEELLQFGLSTYLLVQSELRLGHSDVKWWINILQVLRRAYGVSVGETGIVIPAMLAFLYRKVLLRLKHRYRAYINSEPRCVKIESSDECLQSTGSSLLSCRKSDSELLSCLLAKVATPHRH